MAIIKGQKYGNPWDQVRSTREREQQLQEGSVHGLSARQIEAMNSRMDSFLPQLATPNDLSRIKLPDGMSRSAQVFSGGGGGVPQGVGIFSAGGGGDTYSTPQQPYQPEFASPDRQQYPVHRILANRYWRLFHKLDPVAGNVIDLYSEMLAGQAELTGEGVEGEIKRTYEEMLEKTKVFSLFPSFIREFLVLGEAVPHCFFDDDLGIWTFIAMHNPDQLEVIYSPFVNMEPIVEYIPDDKLRQILSSSDPMLAKVRASMPAEIIARLQARQNIPLDSLNMTFLARRLHPYDVRGTSIYSRLWRVFMFEDAIFSASIATARRHAGPIKIAKIGNPATGWIPGPEHEKRLLELLARAELDPHAFLVYHYGVQFEAFGTTDRMMSITREWDIIERMKLVALGVSKAFMHGEVTYASATTGLQVFLQRLLALRSYFETEWWYPKFFRPVAEINEWIKPTQAELSHRVRTKRTAAELEDADRYIVPTLMWDRKLDPHIDSALLGAVAQLEQLGVKISKGTKAAAGGFDYEDESRKVVEETQFEQEIGIAPPPMMGMPGQMPGAPAMGATTPQMQYGQEGEEVESDNEKEPISEKNQDIEDLKVLLVSGDTENERWLPLMGTKEFEKMIYEGDMEGAWDYLQEYLVEMDDASDDEIENIREELVVSKIIPPTDIDKLKEMEANLPEDTGVLRDDQIEDALSGKVIPIRPETKNDALLSGVGGNPYRTLNPSLSKKVKIPKKIPQVKLETPEIDDPTNYKSRGEWQKVLDKIPLSDDAKKYIKQVENSASDGWEESFEGVWDKVENLLNQGMPITSDTLLELMSSGSNDLRKNISKEDIKNSLMGIYHNGKMYAYEPTGFAEKKKKLLAKRGFKKKSITIDTVDDHVILDTLANSALGKVTSIGDTDLRQLILDRLTDPSMVEKNPLAIANEVVREERRRRELGTGGQDEASRGQLKEELRQLYEDQTWKIERIMRSEALGAYWTATLRGYREQGIRKIIFNAHMGDNKTCALCRGYNGTEFDIDELLALPSPLLAHLTHPNCRCWPTPVITGLTFEEFEKEYLADPDKFSDAYHGFDPDVLEIADVLENVTTELTKFKDAPVEVAETLVTLSDKVEGSPYQSEFPSNVQFVSDIAEHPEFVKAIAPEEDMRNQVVSWDSPSGVTYVSMFSMEKGDVTSTMVRTWAQNIWDEHPELQGNFREMYNRAAVRTVPDDINSTTAKTIAETYEPFMVGRKIWVEDEECVGLNKKFRDMEDDEAVQALNRLGITDSDAEVIVNWRRSNPTWNLNTGEFIETDIPNTVNKFVDAQAGESPQDMFIESLVVYVRDPIRLQTRDPDLYEYLKSEFFGGQEFIDTPAL